jgi:hypothetical protein
MNGGRQAPMLRRFLNVGTLRQNTAAFSGDISARAVSLRPSQRYGCAAPREAVAAASPPPVWDRVCDEARTIDREGLSQAWAGPPAFLRLPGPNPAAGSHLSNSTVTRQDVDRVADPLLVTCGFFAQSATLTEHSRHQIGTHVSDSRQRPRICLARAARDG